MLAQRFMVASLPRIEILFYFTVWITHSLMALYISWNVCSRLRHKFFLSPSEFINGYPRDGADPEWTFYRKSLMRILVVNVLHTLLFKVCPRLLPKQSQYLLLLFWVAAQVFLTSTGCVMWVAVLAAIVGVLAYYLRSEMVSWLLIIVFMVQVTSVAYFSKTEEVYYREFNYYLYSAVKVLNFCVYLSRNRSRTVSASLILRYAQYVFYPPYAVILIVLFDDFDAQMTQIEKAGQERWKCVDYRNLFVRLIRILIWFFAFEVLLHTIYVHSLFYVSPDLFNTLSEYELASVAYVNGKLFYMKYLLIFGIPSWFALADGMRPPQGPICISRISKYSRMWRTFDSGLYQFLKNQVYVPVVGKPSGRFYSLRRFVALVSVFLFVLAWHGTSSNYICWVLLSALELCIEWFGAAVSNTAPWRKIQNILGGRGERRLVATLMLATVVPGIFGVFFFLSRRDIGNIIFKRLLVSLPFALVRTLFCLPGRSLKLSAMSVHFLVLGYCFNHVCLELENYFAARKLHEDKVKQKSA